VLLADLVVQRGEHARLAWGTGSARSSCVATAR
jgi:hypothetical protein